MTNHGNFHQKVVKSSQKMKTLCNLLNDACVSLLIMTHTLISVQTVETITNHTPYISFRGGGGVHPDYFVQLDFEIAVDQQTRARDRTFEGVPDSG